MCIYIYMLKYTCKLHFLINKDMMLGRCVICTSQVYKGYQEELDAANLSCNVHKKIQEERDEERS